MLLAMPMLTASPEMKEVAMADEPKKETTYYGHIIAPSRGVDTGFEGVLWGDIPVRKYNKIKRGARNWAPLGLKAPQCGAFQGFETAV